MKKRFLSVSSGLLFLVLSACSTPAQKFLKTSQTYHFVTQTVSSSPFLHRLYLNQKASKPSDRKTLHVYIDGDGTPWERNRWIAKDPTSRNPLILKMMSQDPASAILLGRPCYHGVNDSACSPKDWTSHRYSKQVVTSMVQALKGWAVQNNYQELVIIGFSGGGALAVLIAPYLKTVTKVVTVSANLDVDGWSEHHGYLPLSDSLNPIDLPPLPSYIKQFHFAGLQDKNVPPEIIKKFSKRQKYSVFIPVAEFNHYCCWADNWKSLLLKILVD